jgi:3'(2'), 5'-bisphosphate nucleotidase
MTKIPTNLPVLAQIAKEAGDAIRVMQADIVANKDWETKQDGSAVTPADKKAHQIIKQRLAEQFPNVALLSEEGTAEEIAEALKQNERFESDPLDNTSGFIKGRDGYSVNIGRVKDGFPVEGAIYFPARNEMFYTHEGKAWFQKGDDAPKEIKVKALPLRNPLQVAGGFSQTSTDYLGDRAHDVIQHPAQYRTCMVARGDCDVAGFKAAKVDDNYNTWDVAGPHAVLMAAGGDFVTESGQPLRYGTDSYKVPNFIAGGVDTLKALGFANPQYFKTTKAVGF